MPDLESYENALQKVEQLYPTPRVLARASERMQDPNVEVYDIVELLKTDPSLTTDIIRLSNSAYYGFEIECTNLSSAISRVGFKEVIRLIGLSISKNLLNRDLSHYAISSDDYWADSLSTALLMEGLALFCAEKPQDAYIVGLLHSVGMIVINQILDNFEVDEVWQKEQPVDEWEREVVGFNYAFAGAALLKRWNFPREICHPILHQLKSADETSAFQQRALHFCGKIIRETGTGFAKQEWKSEGIEEDMEMLGLGEEDVRDLLDASRESYVTIKQNLGVD